MATYINTPVETDSDSLALFNLTTAETLVTVSPRISFVAVIDSEGQDPVTDELRVGRPYALHLVDLVLGLLKPGATFLDIGAHIGTFSLSAAAAGASRVISIEANESNAALLRRSALRNEFTAIEIHECAAAASSGMANYVNAGPWSGFVVTDDLDPRLLVTNVRTASIDSILEESGVSHVDCVKIDIEGSEMGALKGLLKLLSRPDAPPIIIESNGPGLAQFGFTPEMLKAELHRLQYSIYFVMDHVLIPVGPDEIQVLSGVDYLAVKGHFSPPSGWTLRPSFSRTEITEQVMTQGTNPHDGTRAWTAAVLERSEAWLVENPAVAELLAEFKRDDSPCVREATEWYAIDVNPSHSASAATLIEYGEDPEVIAPVVSPSSASPTTLKVLHLSSWKGHCGIGDYAASLAENLERHGVANSVFRIRVAETRWMPQAELLRFFDEALAASDGHDIVHIQHEFAFFRGAGQYLDSCKVFAYVLRGLQKRRIPAVVTFHTEPEFHRLDMSRMALVKAMMRRRIWKHYVAPFFAQGKRQFHAIAHTPKTRYALTQGGFAPENVSVIPLATPVRDTSIHTKIERAEAKRLLGLPENCILLSMFGFISSYKGHTWAVEVLKTLPTNYRLAIIGGGHPDSEGELTLDSILQAWNRRDPKRLIVTGYVRREILELYHAATDICLAPYVFYHLSSSAAITWALTSGRPVIASRIPAFRFINEQAECMSLVAPYAVHELAWAIQRLANDPEYQERLVSNAIEYCKENSWPIATSRILRLYENLRSSAGH